MIFGNDVESPLLHADLCSYVSNRNNLELPPRLYQFHIVLHDFNLAFNLVLHPRQQRSFRPQKLSPSPMLPIHPRS